MSGHFKRPVVSETYLNPVNLLYSVFQSVSPVSNTSLKTPSTYLLPLLICLTQGSCNDPADGAVVSTGAPRCSRTRWSTGRSRSKPGEKKDVCVGFDTVSYIQMTNNIFSKKSGTQEYKGSFCRIIFWFGVFLFLSLLSLFADLFIYLNIEPSSLIFLSASSV